MLARIANRKNSDIRCTYKIYSSHQDAGLLLSDMLSRRLEVMDIERLNGCVGETMQPPVEIATG